MELLNVSRMVSTPITLSAELRAAFSERNILTTRSRVKLLSALDNLDKKSTEERRWKMRASTIREIYLSEITYLQQLEIIMKFFMEPLKRQMLIPLSIYSIIFGNIETLYQTNGELLQELKHEKDNVGAAFLKLAPFLKLYSVYPNDYKQALSILEEAAKTKNELWNFVTKQEKRPEVGTSLPSLLITPIQRIPRYRLLLKELLSHTDSSHPHYVVLREAFIKVGEAANHIDRLMSEYEHGEKMLTLVRRFNGKVPNILVPGRKILREGILMKVSKNGRTSHPRYAVLFTDSLMLCKGHVEGRLTFSRMFHLKECQIEPIMSSTVFRINQEESILLYTSDPNSGKRWMDALRSAVKQYEEDQQTLCKENSRRRLIRKSDLAMKEGRLSLSPSKVGCLNIFRKLKYKHKK